MLKLAGDHVMVLVGAYDLTGDSNKITFNDSRKTLDATAFGDAVQKFILGQRQSSIQHTGYMDAAVARSHPVLKSAELNAVVTVIIGQNAAPVAGDPAYSLYALQSRYQTLPEVGKVVPFTAAYSAGKGTRDGWGTLIAQPTTINNSTTGVILDQGASTTSGGAVFLHLLTAPVTDQYTVLLEGADNAGFSSGVVTHATFDLSTISVGSGRAGIAGTIKQFIRWKATRTNGSAGDSVKFAMNLVRF